MRFTLDLEVPGLPEQGLLAYAVWVESQGGVPPSGDQGVRNWGYLGKPTHHRLTSLDVANWSVRDHYGFPSLQTLTSFLAWFEEDAQALAAKVRGWIHRHHANIQVLATVLLNELKQ